MRYVYELRTVCDDRCKDVNQTSTTVLENSTLATSMRKIKKFAWLTAEQFFGTIREDDEEETQEIEWTEVKDAKETTDGSLKLWNGEWSGYLFFTIYRTPIH